MDKNYKWNSQRLRALVDEKGTSRSKLAYEMGLHPARFKAYDDGIATPTQEELVIMADFFGVSVDFLLGESDNRTPCINQAIKEKEQSVPNKSDVQHSTTTTINVPEGYIAIWPYNLIDVLLGNHQKKTPYNEIVASDQIKGLDYVIEKRLNSKQRDILLSYYKEGETLEVIGKRYSVTRERIRQILVLSVKILRHPASKKIVEAGYYGSRILEEETRLQARELALRTRIKLLEEREALVNTREEQFKEQSKELETIVAENNILDKKITELNLSNRSENALRRTGLNTINDVLNYMRNKNLKEIRNLGNKSLQEITGILHKYCTDYGLKEFFYLFK